MQIADDVEATRTLQIDGSNPHHPQSVFISAGAEFCIEVDRQVYLEMIRAEFDLVPIGLLAMEFAA